MLRVDGTVVVSPGRLVELAHGEVVEGAPRGDGVRADGGGPQPSAGPPGEGLDRARRLLADTGDHISHWYEH